jgi:hypothetical protein
MRVPNDLPFDVQTYLLFSIYYRALKVGDDDQSVTNFLEQFKKQIQAMGRVLEWLGLAYPSRKSRLGMEAISHYD